MDSRLRLIFLIVLVVLFVVPLSPASSQPRTHLGVRVGDMVSLTAAVAVGATTNLTVLGSGDDFIVPSGKAFILTDIIISPQVVPSSGTFLVQVLPSQNVLTSALTVTSSAAEPSSFKVNLTAGMVFPADSNVRVSLVFGSSPINVSAFGYLVTARQD